MSTALRTRIVGVVVAGCAFAGVAATTGVAEAAPAGTVGPDSISACTDTVPPSWFYEIMTNAAKDDTTIPDSWGTSHDMARIVCYESSYRTSAVNGSYHGLGQMSETSVAGTGVSWDRYLHGTADHHIAYYQLKAAMRYAKARYGTPTKGWAHEVADGWW